LPDNVVLPHGVLSTLESQDRRRRSGPGAKREPSTTRPAGAGSALQPGSRRTLAQIHDSFFSDRAGRVAVVSRCFLFFMFTRDYWSSGCWAAP
jgi:hypothetical protein